MPSVLRRSLLFLNNIQTGKRPRFKDFVIEYVLPKSNEGQLSREEAMFNNACGRRPIKSCVRGAAWEAPEVEDEAYADGRVAAETIQRLQAAAKKADRPFFIACGFARPHLPFVASKKYWDLQNPAKLPMPEYEEASRIPIIIRARG